MKRPKLLVILSARSLKAILGTVSAVGLAAVLYLILPNLTGKVTPVIAIDFSEAVSGATVVVDPGHGGEDPGAVGRSGVYEKHAVLGISLKLKPLLERSAVYTYLTRSDDRDLSDPSEPDLEIRVKQDMRGRANLVKARKADILVSIHANSFPSPIWSGAQTFYNPKDPLSKLLAKSIQSELVSRLGPNYREAKAAGDLFMLKESGVPAAMVEVGFLSNPQEETLLADPKYQDRVALAIYHGIVRYFVRLYAEKEGLVPPEKPAPVEDPSPGQPEIRRADGNRLIQAAPLRLADDEGILYFKGPTNLSDGLVAEVRRLPNQKAGRSVEERAEALVLQLIQGPGKGSMLVPTFPKGTRLRSVRVQEGVAWIDFSRELREGFWKGSRSEELTLYSLVNTLTEIPEIDAVQILIEGEPASSIGGHVILDGPFYRNLELIEALAGTAR